MSNLELKILYRDERYTAIEKPPGILVHKSAIDPSETVFCLQLLRDQIGKRVYPCHRLDKPTSGVLLFATDKPALLEMNKCFEQRVVQKKYLAIVRGWPERSGRVEKHLVRDPDYGGGHGNKPREAITEYRLMRKYEIPVSDGRFNTSRYALVELLPLTGRLHQLRRHMQYISHPIIGDTRYGKGFHNRIFREHFNSSRLLLQAVQMEFVHPFTGEKVSISSEEALDFSIPLPTVE